MEVRADNLYPENNWDTNYHNHSTYSYLLSFAYNGLKDDVFKDRTGFFFLFTNRHYG